MEIQWSLVLFTAISGIGACSFAAACLQALLGKGDMPGRLECAVSFCLVAIGGCISVTHIIHHLDRIVAALSHPTSGIFIEALLTGIMCLIIAVFFVMLAKGVEGTPLKVVAVLGIAAALVYAFECGNSYNMGSRPAWTTYTLPLGYCLTALAGGCALNLLLKGVLRADEERCSFAGKIALAGGALGLVGIAAFSIAAGSHIGAAAGSAMWIVISLLLDAAVAGAGFYCWKKKPGFALSAGACAAACGFIGAIGFRVLMWTVGTPILDFFLM
ncbi:MAG: DmsC/YnfH family molybdoenzyme membrane anchor subunit [Coriobacteriales bacterium]